MACDTGSYNVKQNNSRDSFIVNILNSIKISNYKFIFIIELLHILYCIVIFLIYHSYVF